jgi:hypothetical protein
VDRFPVATEEAGTAAKFQRFVASASRWRDSTRPEVVVVITTWPAQQRGRLHWSLGYKTSSQFKQPEAKEISTHRRGFSQLTTRQKIRPPRAQ